MTVLATAFAEGGSERHEPVLMTIKYGKGRVFHTVMGHSHTSMGGVAFQETLIRGTEWAATGKVSFAPVTARDLPADRARLSRYCGDQVAELSPSRPPLPFAKERLCQRKIRLAVPHLTIRRGIWRCL